MSIAPQIDQTTATPLTDRARLLHFLRTCATHSRDGRLTDECSAWDPTWACLLLDEAAYLIETMGGAVAVEGGTLTVADMVAGPLPVEVCGE